MNPLSKYILRQHFGPFLFGCALIIFVLVIDVVLQMMDQILSKGLSFKAAGQLFFYNLGWIIALAVPMAVLVAVLMAFGRMSADSEILALKASGIGLLQLMKPVLVTAVILTAIMILFNDRILPNWNHTARNIQTDLKKRKASIVLKQKEGVFIRELGDYSMLIRRVDEEANKLFGVTLIDSRNSGPPQVLHATEANVEIFDDEGLMRLTLFDGEFHRIDSQDPRQYVKGHFDRQVIRIQDNGRTTSPHFSSSSYRSDREMDVKSMWQAIAKYRFEQIRLTSIMDSTVVSFLNAVSLQYEQDFLDSGKSEMHKHPDPNRRTETLADHSKKIGLEFEKHHRSIKQGKRRINAYLVEIHKKFSIAAACLVFVLVGAPVGALVRTRGPAIAVVTSLLFFFAYWMFLIGGEGLADRGFIHPGVAMWAPNLFFSMIGILLLRAVAFDRPPSGKIGQSVFSALYQQKQPK